MHVCVVVFPVTMHFICDLCNARYMRQELLKDHMRIIHHSTPWYECYECCRCNQKFHRLDEIQHHYDSHHSYSVADTLHSNQYPAMIIRATAARPSVAGNIAETNSHLMSVMSRYWDIQKQAMADYGRNQAMQRESVATAVAEIGIGGRSRNGHTATRDMSAIRADDWYRTNESPLGPQTMIPREVNSPGVVSSRQFDCISPYHPDLVDRNKLHPSIRQSKLRLQTAKSTVKGSSNVLNSSVSQKDITKKRGKGKKSRVCKPKDAFGHSLAGSNSFTVPYPRETGHSVCDSWGTAGQCNFGHLHSMTNRVPISTAPLQYTPQPLHDFQRYFRTEGITSRPLGMTNQQRLRRTTFCSTSSYSDASSASWTSDSHNDVSSVPSGFQEISTYESQRNQMAQTTDLPSILSLTQKDSSPNGSDTSTSHARTQLSLSDITAMIQFDNFQHNNACMAQPNSGSLFCPGNPHHHNKDGNLQQERCCNSEGCHQPGLISGTVGGNHNPRELQNLSALNGGDMPDGHIQRS